MPHFHRGNRSRPAPDTVEKVAPVSLAMIARRSGQVDFIGADLFLEQTLRVGVEPAARSVKGGNIPARQVSQPAERAARVNQIIAVFGRELKLHDVPSFVENRLPEEVFEVGETVLGASSGDDPSAQQRLQILGRVLHRRRERPGRATRQIGRGRVFCPDAPSDQLVRRLADTFLVDPRWVTSSVILRFEKITKVRG